MTSRPNGCVSAIGARLWAHGRLLSPIARSALSIDPKALSSFADFQRRLRLPVRLACFVASRIGFSKAHFAWAGMTSPPADAAKDLLGPTAYSAALCAVRAASATRSEPALIYGQRFITPESAVCRASLLRDRMPTEHSGSVLFIGDDDLVSVAFATIAPRHRISLIDIDPTVVENVARFSSHYGVEVEAVCGDVASSLPSSWHDRFDCVVGDPYPSADHSFEAFFAQAARPLLRPSSGAFVLLTAGPTHKPPAFEHSLIHHLESVGWNVEHITESLAEYELIAGELTQLEEQYLGIGDPKVEAISHTKSYVLLRPRDRSRPNGYSFDVSSWLRSLRHHDLVVRTGGQQRIEDELASRQSPWTRPMWGEQLTTRGIDLTALLSDLLGDTRVARQLAELAQQRCMQRFEDDFSRACGEFADADRLVEEAAVLVDASLEGSRRTYRHESVEAELYLLARLYESYWRSGILEESAV